MSNIPYSPTQLEIAALRDFLSANGFRVWPERLSPCLEIEIGDARLAWEEITTQVSPVVAQLGGKVAVQNHPLGMFSFNISGNAIRLFPSQDHTIRDFIFEIAQSMRTVDVNADIVMPAADVWEKMRTSYFTMDEAYHVAAIADDMGAEYCQTMGHEGRVHVAVVPDVGQPSINWKQARPDGPVYLASDQFRASRGPNDTYIILPGRGQSAEDFVASLEEIMTVDRTPRVEATPGL
jgi:hypothetical protein